MDADEYEQYTGLPMPKAVGATVQEALDKYLKDVEAANEQHEHELTNGVPKRRSAIEFTGIKVDVSNEDQKLMIDLTNHAIEKWLPVCMLHARDACTEVEKQSPTADKEEETGKDVADLHLNATHHVTLFYYGLHDSHEQLEDPRIKDAYEELQYLDPESSKLLEALTPYEFAVAIFYRYFYKIRFPFDRRKTKHVEDADATPLNEVNMILRHVVFVPGVVMCATAHLGKPLVALPSPDGKLGPYDDYDDGGVITMDEFIKECGGAQAIMLEEDHCTHVTLGVTKAYKPVVSNNICQGIRDYLTYVKVQIRCGKEKEGLFIKKVMQDEQACDMDPRELIECLEIYGAGFSRYKFAKPNIVELAPAIAYEEDEVMLMEHAECSVLETSVKKEESILQHCYKDTMCFVSEDKKCIFIKHLPISRSVGHAGGKEKDDWVVDAYLCALDKPVTGKIQFYASA
ncbi:hypothetical protein BgAZ_301800 [Babesia gibsoni]|uniref:Uncharacterized protein n=1 Tax=Babesia gibsoni TaxID=33632 RepID=A0AAD8LQR8_BABGI|nr:hypothetical protein BgAZ_301800 [Babesia gibsoni]